MTHLTNWMDDPSPKASATQRLRKDTAGACRDRATADLLTSVVMATSNERLALERSAQAWTLRAELLERVERSFEKRRALEKASRQCGGDHVRL